MYVLPLERQTKFLTRAGLSTRDSNYVARPVSADSVRNETKHTPYNKLKAPM